MLSQAVQNVASAPKVFEIMQKAIMLMDADPMGNASLLALLGGQGYAGQRVGSLAELRHKLGEEKFMAVLMDIDSVAVDNRAIRELAAGFPATPFCAFPGIASTLNCRTPSATTYTPV